MTDQQINKLTEQIIGIAKHKGITIATAESCTGGWIGKTLTDVPGSSSVFMGSLVAYSNDIKENLLGVSKEILVAHGAVSQNVAFEMAKNCAQSFASDIALSVTGIAGPGGGSKEKPVGLVYIGIHFRGETETFEYRFENSGRHRIRREALVQALALLKDRLDLSP